MPDPFESILDFLAGTPAPGSEQPAAVDAPAQFLEQGRSEADNARRLNAAFLISLCGSEHPLAYKAQEALSLSRRDPALEGLARFYLEGVERVKSEIRLACERDPDFLSRLRETSAWMKRRETAPDPCETAEKTWSVFFPEGTGIQGFEKERARSLRKARRVNITSKPPAPIRDPGTEILFTANVLLTIPPDGGFPGRPALSEGLRRRLDPVLREPQRTWYDHPVQIGTAPENNEILYGLKGLNEAMAFEKARGTLARESRAVCLLSVSVTHAGLQDLAGDYIREEIRHAGGLEHLHVFAFTEADTRRLGQEVLKPAAKRFLGEVHPLAAFPGIFGVDGEYGRHYSFLKAIAPLWQVLVDASVRATFKIDLDQVFPQEILVLETGASALEHLAEPLWGARGKDSLGRTVELGLLAGALVNDGDIHEGLFTPDIRFPKRPPKADEFIFFSPLPQALSTEAEMMTRYGRAGPYGRMSCIQRVHVTGGTTGALVDTLRRYRPFSPSFLGRAEDQAFIMASLAGDGPRPAYLHRPGLIMRHDKESFTMEAVRSAHLSKLIGDDIRILVFSAYARAVSEPLSALKQVLDPFTGAFISPIPQTLVHLRSAMRAADMFSSGRPEQALQLVREGAERIGNTLTFTQGEDSPLRAAYERERRGWNVYYDVIEAMEKGLAEGGAEAQRIRASARRIVRECALTS